MKMPSAPLKLCLAVVLTAASAQPILAQDRDVSSLGFIKGYSWGWVGSRGDYAGPEAADSLKKLAETGVTWVCIAFAPELKTYDDPSFQWGDANPRLVTDDEIRRAIDLARENGMEVILKPVVNCDDGTWRAWIRFFRPATEQDRADGFDSDYDAWGETPMLREGMVRDMEKWDQWWKNYTAFIVHYAKIAQEKNVKVLCLGCEMNSTEEFENQWRELIAEVRKVYDGLLTYDVNHGREDEIRWWDDVDFISISAYYPLPPPEGQSLEEAARQTTTVEEIVRGHEAIKTRLANVSQRQQKPILFIETGVTNVRGCARYPWSHEIERVDSPIDDQEQANYYEAMSQVYWDEPWFMGFCWWEWPARLYDAEDAAKKRSFCAHGRKAEEVMRKWYAKPREKPAAE
jgi:hypothetical protein